MSLRAMARPRPRLPPVTTTLRMMPRKLAGLGDIEGGNEADHGRHLVLGETGAAALHDLPFERSGALACGILLATQQNVGNHDFASDRVASRAHERHAHVGVAV